MKQDLFDALVAATGPIDPPGRREIYRASTPPAGGSEMLFFLKPELMRSPALARIAAMAAAAFDAHGLGVERVIVLSGSYLERHGIIAEHYGVIDAVARDPLGRLSEQARERFARLFGREPDDRVVGGIDYLERHPELDAESLAARWLAAASEKLAGGTYCQPLPEEGLYLINGFYPRMLRNFTSPAARVAGFVLRGDTPWASARSLFCGATDPAKAARGSLRAELLARREELGLAEVSANLNGVHLSAGPVEGLVELRRFTSDRSGSARSGSREPAPGGSVPGGPRPIEDFLFGRQLLDRFPPAAVRGLLANPTVKTPQGSRSVFDLTEEKDPEEALALLAAVVDQRVVAQGSLEA